MQLKRLAMIGGPFSADTPAMRERNMVATEMLGHAVALAGGAPVVPNAMGRTYDGKPVYEVWIEITLATLARCDAFIVTPEFAKSSGTKREIEEAFFFGVPVFYAKYAHGFTLPETYDADVLRRWLDTPDYGYDLGGLKGWLEAPDHAIRFVPPIVKRRLSIMRKAFGPKDPRDFEAISTDLEVVMDALLAAQSLDDLGPENNEKAADYEDRLKKQYQHLKAA